MTASLRRDLCALLLVAALCGLALVVGETLRRRGASAEWTRKVVHVLSGLVATAFPWIFHGPWPVAVLCAGFLAIMGWTQRRGGLQSVHGVPRRTAGGLCFPLAVGLVFALSGHRAGVYVACLLVLTLSDPLAALVGTAYGRHPFRTGPDAKSVEGSLAFLVSAFLCIAVSLQVLTPLGRTAGVLGALYAAVVATGLEAASPGGSDNLSVPLGTYLVLVRVDAVSPWALVVQLLALLGLVAALGSAVRGSPVTAPRTITAPRRGAPFVGTILADGR